MPLDSAAYLTSLGWQGAGSGLRKDGMIRPLAIPQKRTLAGVGKDRDEAFPFWDHVFNAAANSIKIKIYNDSDQSDAESEQTGKPDLVLSRTSTGILSNRRPAVITSGSATPKQTDDTGHTNKPRLSLLAEAKRQAAYTRLYASFFRGPVIAPLNEIEARDEKETQKPDTLINGDTTIDQDMDAPSKSNLKGSSQNKSQKKKATQSEITTTELENHKEEKKKRKKKKGRDASSETDLVEENGLSRPKKKRRKAFAEDHSTAELQGNSLVGKGLEDHGGQKKHKKRKSKPTELQEEITNDVALDKTQHERKRSKKKRKKDDGDRCDSC